MATLFMKYLTAHFSVFLICNIGWTIECKGFVSTHALCPPSTDFFYSLHNQFRTFNCNLHQIFLWLFSLFLITGSTLFLSIARYFATCLYVVVTQCESKSLLILPLWPTTSVVVCVVRTTNLRSVSILAVQRWIWQGQPNALQQRCIDTAVLNGRIDQYITRSVEFCEILRHFRQVLSSAKNTFAIIYIK